VAGGEGGGKEGRRRKEDQRLDRKDFFFIFETGFVKN
jgi:hypothetical protein